VAIFEKVATALSSFRLSQAVSGSFDDQPVDAWMKSASSEV